MNQSSLLFRLQKTDSELDLIRNQLIKIDAELNNDSELILTSQEHDKSLAEFHKIQKTLTGIEEDVKTLRIKLAQSESSLYGGKIRNPKELQDLQNEIESLKRRMSSKEDEQLETMMQYEEAEKKEGEIKKKLDMVAANLSKRKETLKAERATLIKNQERLNHERQAALSSISPDLIEIYNRLYKQKRGLAIVEIIDGNCAACGATVRPAEMQAAKAASNLVYCASCGRIYFVG